MGQLRVCSKKGYKNNDSIDRVVYYTLNTKREEDPTEHTIFSSGLGVCSEDVQRAISEFKSVQRNCRCPSTIGTRIYHEYFTLSKDEGDVMLYKKRESLYMFAEECARIFYESNHQVIYIVRYGQTSGFQIHFLVNTVNHDTTRKWYRDSTSAFEREKIMNQMLQKYL